MSLADTLIARWQDNPELMSTKLFEHKYNCTLLFTTDLLSDLRDTHPEYFI